MRGRSDRDAPAARRGVGAALAAALLTALAGASPPGAGATPGMAGPDTLSFRIETGAGADYSNELYYEDAFVDTTFLGRRRVDTPEPRYAGMLYTVLGGTYGRRRASWQVQNELSLGDKLRRDALGVVWRDEFAPDWRLVLTPGFEWRHDRSFDRDQSEVRGTFRGRLRRSFADETRAAELGVFADLLRSRGTGSEYLPDRNAVRGSFAVDHLGLLGDEWRLGYSLAARAFPDSASRDHLEHGFEARWRRPFGAGHAVLVEATGRRRQTRRFVPTTRDNYREEALALEGDWRAADRWVLRGRIDGEALQYDVEEPDVYFDYQVARARLALRHERDARWSLAAGPRAERLASRLSPGEEYLEVGGAVEFEWLGRRSLWSVSPSAGWREYDGVAGDALASGVHSSYAFYQLDAFVDQPLPAGMRLRAIVGLRHEAHTDPSQDAASVQLSTQLRWALP